ncbi:MAG: hypothetical protein HC902_12030 [Calothrix sp. SM1_5_4]|nr:hypothetical protein [Calothrix sp. SM1_5_4]
MLYSGADLIKTSGTQNDRLERLKVVTDPVAPAPATEKSASSGLDEQTQGALLRFARFVRGKAGEERKAKSQPLPCPKPKRSLSGTLIGFYMSVSRDLKIAVKL